MEEKLDVENNRAVIIPTAHHPPPSITSTTMSNKPLGSATRFDWANKQPSHHHQQQQPRQSNQQIPEGESRTCQIRRNSQSQRNLSLRTKLCYRMADLVVVMCIVFPLAIAFWRGVWQIMDYHSVKWGVDPYLSMAVGYIIPFCLHYFQEPLKRNVCLEKMSFPLFYTLSRTTLLLHSVGSVNQWRGLWVWMDNRYGLYWENASVSMAVGICLSITCKTLNNILAPPLFCVIDEAKSIHDCPLRFQTPPDKPLQYFLDCFFSVVVIPGIVVLCWRGLWNLADIFLYPGQDLNSCIASMCVGYAICIMLCLAQPTICQRARNLKGYYRLAYMDSMCIIGFVGCVLAWRGVWNSYNIFLKFDTPTLSEWITTFVGAFGTMICGCISVVVVRGIAIDGVLVEEGAADWLIPYISNINTPIYDVPFPEPWICRYFCTSQKVGGKRKRRQDPIDSKLVSLTCPDGEVGNLSNDLKPLKIANSLSNSIHPVAATGTVAETDYLNKNANVVPGSTNLRGNNRFRLSDLPNIDSSSEEELGMRTRMIPPGTTDDDRGVNKGNNNDGNNDQSPPPPPPSSNV